MSEYHGIIDRGRTYAAGNGGPTTAAQDRRITQEVFRHLASLVEGVDAEQLLETLGKGLDEIGYDRYSMDNLLKFFDAVRAKLEGPTVTVVAELTPADVHFGLTPSIINTISRRGSSRGLSTSEERELVQALLGHIHVRSALLNFSIDNLDTARSAVADVLSDNMLYDSEVTELLRVYEDYKDPEAARRQAERREKQARLEQLRAEAAELEAELG